MRRVARMLVMAGTRREAVKAGIIALGTCGDERDRDLLVVLGSLEEFTLFAVVALTSTQPDRERAVFDLARRVTGWGRIHAVERLASAADPEIQAWLLRDGFRNDVMYEYLACIAATTGHLYEALLDPAADQELVTSAGEILATLSFLGGPAKDMRHYPDAVPAMHRLAELAADREPTLRLLDSLLTLRHFVTPAPEFDWPDGEPARLAARYAHLLARPSWADVTLAAMANPDDVRGFGRALACATRLGIPILQHTLRYLPGHPDDSYAWYMAAKEADDTTISKVTSLAAALLPLDDIATGPASALGLGPGYRYDHVLETVIPALGRYPGTGAELVRVALASRVIRVRRAAFRVLRQWAGTYRDWIAAAASAEPYEKLRADMDAYLDGRAAPDTDTALSDAAGDAVRLPGPASPSTLSRGERVLWKRQDDGHASSSRRAINVSFPMLGTTRCLAWDSCSPFPRKLANLTHLGERLGEEEARSPRT